MKLKTVTATGLSVWASYLINGDDSGLDETECRAADSFVNYLGASPVSCEDAGFIHRPDSFLWHAVGGDCQTYTALIQEIESPVAPLFAPLTYGATPEIRAALVAVYLDFVNNYATVKIMAGHYGLRNCDMEGLINAGRDYQAADLAKADQVKESVK